MARVEIEFDSLSRHPDSHRGEDVNEVHIEASPSFILVNDLMVNHPPVDYDSYEVESQSEFEQDM